MRPLAFSLALLLASPAFAQQHTDPAKLLPLLRQQRETANDNVAACAVAVADLQAKIAELEKKLAQTEKPPEK